MFSGGGSRGAYEAGVLSALVERSRPGRAIADLVCGTSIGAISGAFLAAEIDTPRDAAEELERLWSTLTLEDVLGFDLRQVSSLPRLFLGSEVPSGLFDSRAIATRIAGSVRWARIGEHLASGRLRALTVTATHLPTGRPTVFVQRRPDVPPPQRMGHRVVVQDAVIGPSHVLASGAIPILFPSVSVGGELYCDGGLRLNTPLGPAIRLGAERVLVTALSTAHQEPELPTARYPGAVFLLGKVLNAFLLDHVMSDLDELYRINKFLEDGRTVYGDDFDTRIGAYAASRGAPSYHLVEPYVVRPSEDLGVIAAHHLRRMRWKVGRVSPARLLLRLLDSREARSADLASYLLFDREYTRDLVELGRRDGRAASDVLDAFLAD